jgi:hypothetical protein
MKPPACPPPGEDQAVDAVVSALHAQMRHDYPPPGLMRRDAHPKAHGVVQGELVVDPAIPADLRHGVFARPGDRFRAWIRFSNCFRIQPDIKSDTRGMAVKLLDVKGDTFVPSESGTQDFLGATGDAFFVPDAIRYVGFPQAAVAGLFATMMFFVQRRLWQGLAATRRSFGVLAMNPLAIDYFSQTPYRLGESHSVKFQIRPLLTRSLGESLPWAPLFRLKAFVANLILNAGGLIGAGAAAERACRWIAAPDYLRDRLAASLRASDAWFEVSVQRQVGGMPIEDATASWDPAISPYERVAWIRIPRQVFSTAHATSDAERAVTQAMETLGEHLSFNPWHAVRAHEPLGSINRVRLRTNNASSVTRHDANRVPLGAPSIDDFDRIAKQARLAPGTVDPRPERDPATFRSRWAYVYLRRVPLLVGAAMALFPIATTWHVSPLSRLSRGIFDVEGPALFLVSLLASLLALTVLTTWWVITAYGGERCRARCAYAVYPIRARWYALASLLLVPVIGATLSVADRSGWGAADWMRVAACWVSGFAVAAVVAWAVRWMADFLGGMVAVQDLARRVSRPAVLSAGFVDTTHDAFLPGHLFTAGMALVCMATYLTIGSQTAGELRPEFPGLVFLILLPIVVCWPLSWLTFFVDRFRVPVLLPLAALLFLIHDWPGPRYVFELSSIAQRTLSPADVLSARLTRAASQDAVIVVAASGGGVQSAIWTARVLTGIEERCRRDGCRAAEAIAAISATSGGGVGAMQFVAAYDNGALPVDLAPIVDRSASSGQDALWRALVFEDLYRPLRVLRRTPKYSDRGRALEQAWTAGVSSQLLDFWRADASAGTRPGMIFNATLKDDNRPILISSAGTVPGAADFHEYYGGYDIPIVRAARLSSTFPIVVPFARDGRGIHAGTIIDGGYTDQFGIDGAVRWLDAALRSSDAAHRPKRALLLEIQSPLPPASVLPSPRWTDQFERDRRGVQLLQVNWKESVAVSSLTLQLCAPSFTQWHATRAERDAIIGQWDRDRSGPAVDAVVRFLKGGAEPAGDDSTPLPQAGCR